MRAAATVVYWVLVYRHRRGCQNVLSLSPSTTTRTFSWLNPALLPSEVVDDEVLLSPASLIPLSCERLVGDSMRRVFVCLLVLLALCRHSLREKRGRPF